MCQNIDFCISSCNVAPHQRQNCVAAEQRTPSVALAYSILLGRAPEEARQAVLAALPGARGCGALWEAAGELG